MNEISFWKFAIDSINRFEKIVLLTNADSSNSSPGRQGFKLLLCPNGTIKGTVGGGIMEKQLIDYGIELLSSGRNVSSIKRLQHSSKTELEHSGLICGGFQTVIFSILSKKQLQLIEEIIENITKRENGILSLSFNKIAFDKNNFMPKDFFFNYSDDKNYLYKENIGFAETAYIIGGGHVGLAVSEVLKFLGFHVIVFDHRNDIFTMDQNCFADEKIIEEYKSINAHIKGGNKSYVVIVTPQHSGDKDALGSVIKMDLKYIGMMGSNRKIKTVFNNLVKDGIDKKLFEKVHTPIGLPILAETPKEIAISIASEIIKIKYSAKDKNA